MRIQLDKIEHATVLAALRYWAREGVISDGHEQDIASIGDTVRPLSREETISLADRLNR